MYHPKGSVCKSEFIRVARLVMTGDLDSAQKLLNCEPCSWYSLGVGYGERQGYHLRSRSVSEARAIAGACRAAGKMFGININPWNLIVSNPSELA